MIAFFPNPTTVLSLTFFTSPVVGSDLTANGHRPSTEEYVFTGLFIKSPMSAKSIISFSFAAIVKSFCILFII